MNDRQAQFNALVGSLSTDAYRYAVWLSGDHQLAQDLVQETFIRAWKSIDKLRDEKAAKSWLITILRREFLRTFERKRLSLTDIDGMEITDDDGRTPADSMEITTLRRNIAKLDKKYREPLMLQVIAGFTCEEIANELGISKSAVMTQLFRARKLLQRQLEENQNPKREAV